MRILFYYILEILNNGAGNINIYMKMIWFLYLFEIKLKT